MRSFALIALVGAALLSKADKERPVSKVINLLKDMSAELQKEQETDQEVFDKLSCWCETNDKEKNEAVNIAMARISELESTIEELTGKSARLNVEITALKEDIAKNKDALNKATAIRTKELAEFNAEEKDMMQSIQALKNAVIVLGKHHSEDALMSVKEVIKHHMHAKAGVLRGTMSPTQKKTITAFLQQPAGFSSYAPASGQIFGILKQMKETFESNLSQSQKDELAAQDTFASLKSSKEAEIAAASQSKDNKTVELADTDEANAQAKVDLKDTKDALSADQAFLVDLKQKCAQTDEEFAARTKARGEEISAVSEAIAILNDDDAHDLFGKTVNSFAQKRAVLNVEKKARREAIKLLKDEALKSGNTQLAAIATMAQLDAFTKVKAAIDEMVTALTKEKQDEIKHRDFCIEELAQNDKQTAVSTDEKNDLEASIANLEANIDTLSKDIDQLDAGIKEAQVQVKRASEDRELENQEFQQTVADQRAAQVILTKALDRLKVVYGFVQVSQPEPGAAAPPPPPGFSEYKQNAGATGVLSMIQSVINDAKRMENEAIQAENDSQGAYESFVKNTNDQIGADMKEMTNKKENKAKAEEENTQAKADLKSTMNSLQSLAAYAADVHSSCDFVMNNFEMRQAARDQEVEALRQAKAVLSGADFS